MERTTQQRDLQLWWGSREAKVLKSLLTKKLSDASRRCCSLGPLSQPEDLARAQGQVKLLEEILRPEFLRDLDKQLAEMEGEGC
jgi:hypothetical protein